MKTTIALAYYNSPLMLAKQMEYWRDYAQETKVIVIDDHSPIPALDVIKQYKQDVSCQIELYRINEDIYQNVYGARNLAFHVASDDDWIWIVDADHVVPQKSIKKFIDSNSTPFKHYYMPSRRSFVGSSSSILIHKHEDTFILTKETFWKTGGYDEDLVGYYYNGAARKFKDSLRKQAKEVRLRDEGGVSVLFYSAQMIHDASPIGEEDRTTNPHRISHDKKPSILKFTWERQL